MDIGPVEVLAVKFPGNQFRGEIAPALADLVENGTIRVIDFVFVQKDAGGNVTIMELDDLDDDAFSQIDPMISEVSGMISEDDIESISDVLEDNSSAGLMVFENTWATRFRDALERAKGEVLLDERVPERAVEAAIAARTK
jgi:hypothetical protein